MTALLTTFVTVYSGDIYLNETVRRILYYSACFMVLDLRTFCVRIERRWANFIFKSLNVIHTFFVERTCAAVFSVPDVGLIRSDVGSRSKNPAAHQQFKDPATVAGSREKNDEAITESLKCNSWFKRKLIDLELSTSGNAGAPRGPRRRL